MPDSPTCYPGSFEVISASNGSRDIRLHWAPLPPHSAHGDNLTFVVTGARGGEVRSRDHYADLARLGAEQLGLGIAASNEVSRRPGGGWRPLTCPAQAGRSPGHCALALPAEAARAAVPRVTEAVILATEAGTRVVWRQPAEVSVAVSWCEAGARTRACEAGLLRRAAPPGQTSLALPRAAHHVFLSSWGGGASSGLQLVQCRARPGPAGQLRTQLEAVEAAPTQLQLRLVAADSCVEPGLVLASWSLGWCGPHSCSSLTVTASTASLGSLRPATCYEVTHSAQLAWGLEAAPAPPQTLCTGGLVCSTSVPAADNATSLVQCPASPPPRPRSR